MAKLALLLLRLTAISVQVGFAAAFCAELALPSSGLFGAWGSDGYNAFLGAAVLLIGAAGVSSSEQVSLCL